MKSILINYDAAGFKQGLVRFFWSLVRTIAAALATFGISELAKVQPDVVFSPHYLPIASIVFVAIRSFLSFLATWALTVPEVSVEKTEVTSEVVSDQVVS